MPNEIPDTEMQTCLIDLDLTRVALCNTGANSRADILLTKRKENTQMPTPTTFEEVSKSLEAPVLDLINKHFEGLMSAKDTEISDLKKQLDDFKKQAPVTAEPAKTAEPTPEDLLKTASPELAALFKKQQETLDMLVAKEQEALAARRFDAVKAIPCKEEDLKGVLKSISPAGYEVLKAAAQAIEKSVTKEPAGSDAQGVIEKQSPADQAYATLEKSAKDLQAANAGMSFEQAFAQACEQNPDVYTSYVKGA